MQRPLLKMNSNEFTLNSAVPQIVTTICSATSEDKDCKNGDNRGFQYTIVIFKAFDYAYNFINVDYICPATNKPTVSVDKKKQI